MGERGIDAESPLMATAVADGRAGSRVRTKSTRRKSELWMIHAGPPSTA